MDSSPRNVPPREAATAIADRLIGAGFTAYFAGGCVRDRLMGHEPKDYDVVTDARPDQVKQVFPHAHNVGQAFGVMLVRRWGHTIEVATFRAEGEYSDGRRPDEVRFTTAEEDARRRDFTINGLFEEPRSGEIIDYVGGREDIRASVVRAIGEPHHRLHEDRLRMLRAVRFAARFEFQIDPETEEAIREGAHELRGVSRERIGHELRLMLGDPNRVIAAWTIQYLGLDGTVFEEPHVLAAPVRLGRLPEEVGFPAALAAWYLDRHGGDAEATGHGVRRWTRALVLSNDEQQAMRDCLEVQRALCTAWFDLSVAQKKRLAATDAFQPALLLVKATDTQHFADIRREVEQLERSGLSPEPFITGDDLVAEGEQPGPGFRAALDAAYDAQLEGRVSGRADALATALRVLRQAGNGRARP